MGIVGGRVESVGALVVVGGLRVIVAGGIAKDRGGLASLLNEEPIAAPPTMSSNTLTDHVAVFSFGFADCVGIPLSFDQGIEPMTFSFHSLSQVH